MTATIQKPTTKTKVELTPAKKWNVIMLNDDYTPMDFVIAVLMRLYRKTAEEAEAITLDIHHKGRGIAGQYTKEIAEQKVADTMATAVRNGHPLRVQAEQA